MVLLIEPSIDNVQNDVKTIKKFSLKPSFINVKKRKFSLYNWIRRKKPKKEIVEFESGYGEWLVLINY